MMRIRAGLAGRVALAGALALACAAVAACGGDDAESGDKAAEGALNLKIGFSGALTGIYAAYDKPQLDGMQFAAEQINKENGGVHVEIVSVDNKGQQQLQVQTTQRLLDEGAKLQVIGVGDGRTGASRLVSDAGGLAVGGLNGYPSFTQDAGDNSVVLAPPDNVQGAAQGEYACEEGYETAFLMVSNDFLYTKNLPKYFAQTFEKGCGGSVVGEATYSIGATDFSTQVTKIKNLDPQPDVIEGALLVPDVGAFVKQLRQAGVTTPYLNSDASYLGDFLTATGEASEGTVMSGYLFNAPGSEGGDFQEAFSAATGNEPSTPVYEATGRDQVYALVEAAKIANSDDPTKILAALSEIPATATIALRKAPIDPATRLPKTAEFIMIGVKNGEFEELQRIVPGFVPAPLR